MPEPATGAAASAQLRTVAGTRAAGVRGRWAEAAALWRRAVERDPVNGDHWSQLTRASWELDDLAAALTAYGKALELGVTPSDDADSVLPASPTASPAATPASATPTAPSRRSSVPWPSASTTSDRPADHLGLPRQPRPAMQAVLDCREHLPGW